MLAGALGKLRARRLVDDHVVRADGAAPASARRIEGVQALVLQGQISLIVDKAAGHGRSPRCPRGHRRR